MTTLYKKAVFLFVCLAPVLSANAQCSTVTPNGSSTNLFTLIRNSTNPVAADKVLNSVVYIHRNNAGTFGGNSGQLRYDVSYNAGATWTLNSGVLNPLTTNLARYPNVAIYNPTNNTTPSNAYLGYMAATIDPTTMAWNGVVTGISQLNSATSTETYNQPVVSPQLIPHSLVKGAPGVFWAADALYNGVNITGFTIYKGQWNNSTSNITWANNFTVVPSFNTGYSGVPYVGDYNIAFDPTGTFGWFSFLGHVTPGPTAYCYYPVFYKTVDGGVTWTGPIQVDLNTFSCLTGNIGSTYFASTNFEHDLTVDVNGNPHLFTTICNGTNAYSVSYAQWHHMYDVTLKSGLWVAYDVANVQAGRGSWGTSSSNTVYQDMAPQVARSADGTKVFFTWTDNSVYTLGQANQTPNLFGRAYNVTTNSWTPVKDFSSCNTGIAGTMIVPHVAAEVLEPSSSVYKLAPVYGIITSGDPTLTANFNFIDNVTFATTDFSVSPPATPTISIAQGTNVLLCPGSTINISVQGVGQALWSTGSSSFSIPISSPTITTYSLIAQKNCNVGTASITVTNMSISASAPSTSFCAGSTATLNVTGNAVSYSWTPANMSGTNITVTTSTAAQVYTVIAYSNANCQMTSTVGLTVYSLPTVSILGSSTVCVNSVLSLTATGANSYTWSNGSMGSTVNASPTTSIMCMGQDPNGCLSSDTLFIQTLPAPTITAISDKTVICLGGTVNLIAAGAISYTWNPGSTTAAAAIASPTISTVYTVTGADANLCTNTKTISVLVNPLPTVNVSTSRPTLCTSEKAVLTASGAASYLWGGGQTTTTLQITPTITTVYTVTGTDANTCSNKTTFTQTVSACAGINAVSATGSAPAIFPNPNNGEFTIIHQENADIKIINELGQVVRSLSLNDENDRTIKISGLNNGLYFVISTGSGGNHRTKMIVSDR